MSIRKKTLLTFFLILTVLLGARLIWLKVSFVDTLNHLEQDHAQQVVKQENQILAVQLDELVAKSGDWAVWDDSYRFVQRPDAAFIKSNFADTTFVDMKINLIIYLNKEGKVIYQKNVDFVDEAERPVPEEVRGTFQPDKDLFQDALGQTRAGFLLTSQGPMMLVARPILTSERKGPVAGVLIFGRFFQGDVLNQFQKLSGYSTEVIPFHSKLFTWDLHRIKKEISTTRGHFRIINPEESEIFSLVNDLYGNPIFILKATLPRAIFQEGHSQLNFILINFVIVSVLFLVLTLFFLNRWVLVPVKHLEKSVGEITQSGKFSLRMPATSTDEWGNLASGINLMLDRLEASQKSLEESQALFKTAFENAPIGMALLGADGRWLKVNPNLSSMLGYPPDTLLNNYFSLLVDSEDLPADLEGLQKCVEGIQNGYALDERMIRNNGSVLWVHTKKYFVRGKGATSSFFIFQAIDISERIASEAALKKEEEKLIAILNQISEGVVVVGVDGTVKYSNPASDKIFGIPMTMVSPANWTEYFQVYKGSGEKCRLQDLPSQRALLGEEVMGEELIVKRTHLNKEIIVSVCAKPLRNPAGTIEGVLLNFQDISQQKRVDKIKMEFLAWANREIKTPLTSIKGAVNMMAGEAGNNLSEQGKQMVEIISNNSAKIQKLLDDFIKLI